MQSDAPTTVFSQGFEYGVKHFKSPENGNLFLVIQKVLDLTSAEVELLFQLGAIYLEQNRAIHMTQNVEFNQHVRVHTKPRRYKTDYAWQERIVFESQDFVVLNKPSGLPSHPSVDNHLENSLTAAATFLNCSLFITHRLDTLTEGLIVYAKTQTFVQHFNKQLQNKLITKKYIALVETQALLPSQLIHYMEPSPRAPKKVSPNFQEGWAFCELHIEKQKVLKNVSWLKINLLTGRTHQIRAQLAERGAPLVGDHLYGAKFSLKNKGLALRAQYLEFNWQNQSLQFELSCDFDTEVEVV